MNSGLFIVMEGLNGAGKSSLVECLGSKLSALCVCSPPDELLYLRKKMDNGVSLGTRFLYYMLGNSIISDRIRSLRQRNIVICDRYIHSTLATHQLLGLECASTQRVDGLEIPDVSFFITVSDELERRRRIEKRGKKTKYDMLQEDDNFRNRYLEYFKQADGFNFIDTNGLTIKQSAEEIINFLKEAELIG